MNIKKLYLNTLIPELPYIINFNNDEIKNYLDTFYNESDGNITAPVNTTGRIKASNGEFVSVVADNLIVKNQYTNLYENITTADYDYYKMIIGSAFVPRDPCTDSNYWPIENFPNYKVIDVNKPYYKITNANSIILKNDNVSQVVGIYFDGSLVTSDPFTILLNAKTMETYNVNTSDASSYREFICINYDPSYGAVWTTYK